MGREVRMVPPWWVHPKAMHEYAKEMRYVPLLPISYADAAQRWEQEELPGWIEGKRLWREQGLVRCHDGRTMTIAEAVASADVLRRPKVATYEWWAGDRPEAPNPLHYMPDWPAEQRTHYMMYEDTSEGTPLSPAFATPEELARWLADTGASAFAGETATYEQWLAMIVRGSTVCSAVLTPDGIQSGVAALQG